MCALVSVNDICSGALDAFDPAEPVPCGVGRFHSICK